jgi:lincosamide nucleotidyltransferase A/C/D/E
MSRQRPTGSGQQPTADSRRPALSADDVLEILALIVGAGIEVWVDGGWGVDALLGEQTREHRDLDIAVRSEDEPRLREVVGREGFVEVSAEPHNPVLRDGRGRLLDVHFVDMGVTRPGSRGWPVYGDIGYDVGAFEGEGTIAGSRVACTTAVSQVRSHSGYRLDGDDMQDMLALQRRLGIDLPPEYGQQRVEGEAADRSGPE